MAATKSLKSVVTGTGNIKANSTRFLRLNSTNVRCAVSKYSSRQPCARDYAQLSATPDQFEAFADAVGEMMKTEPNYSAAELADIHAPVAIVHSEHDEFIKPEHAEYLARTIPNAQFVNLHGVSHFAPLQRPQQFNSTMLTFLGKALP